ncbi:LOW QUALITY PROTEIN: hypothetical protein BRADI_4g32751v3 [Brachypodium distachyon]|uniref:BRX domain-containing protein n=1 Tax=Brachypodium distachyon TaxID=15368 RepID=A0A2K2CRV8_BRADI|nr:LOW QUALITY PROTEIN: hypothetical protein BRADI_4g32751v3 [Brachypodium distachyon]
MLTCIACSRQPGGGGAPLHEPPEDEDAVDGVGVSEAATPSTRLAIKALTAQIKDMALKASGAYRHSLHHPYHHRGGNGFQDSETASGSERFHYAGDATPSMSARTDFPTGDEEDDDEMLSGGGGSKEDDAKEWVAQVEPGVLITFVSLPLGGNDLKRIRFSIKQMLDMFRLAQAHRKESENRDLLYRVSNGTHSICSVYILSRCD